jgi:hypothetical protein
MAALATLWPLDFRFRSPRIWLGVSAEDLVLNLGLLLPAGFLWRLARPQPRIRIPANLDVLALGLGLSTVLEGLQLFLSRNASPIDVVMNGLGAWAGAALYSRLERGWVDRICLALPLTKVLYLTVPLIGLQAWTARGRYAAIATLLPLAAFSASIAAELYRKSGHRSMARFVVGFAAVFGLIAAPLWARLPVHALVLFPITSTFAWLALRLPPRVPPGERRIELVALKRALPFLGAYLVVIALPRFAGYLSDLGGATAGLYVLRDAAAFSVLGYVFSQLHARRFGGRAESRAAIAAMIATALFGALRSWQLVSELPELGMLVAAGTLGATIHRAELTAIRALRGSTSVRPDGRASKPSLPAPVESV